MKKIIVITLILLAIAGCAAETETDTSLQYILDEKVMIVGYTEYPPLGFKEDGMVTGFDIDIAKEVAKRLEVTPEFVYIDWDSKEFELDSKNIDMIWNGFTITEDRKEKVRFSKPYFDNRIVILSKEEASFNTIADLAGKKVGVELSSSGQISLEKNAIFDELDEMVKYTTITEAILDLRAGGIDAIVADEIFARYAISKDTEKYVIADEVFLSENYGIGFRMEDVALQERIDEILDEMAKDGSALEISMKWFNEDLLKR
jgi:polar amino acid transport system substrate-binding protein